jgi:hypothetical protein
MMGASRQSEATSEAGIREDGLGQETLDTHAAAFGDWELFTRTDAQEPVPGGACEIELDAEYFCEDSGVKQDCDDVDGGRFWTNTTCRQLGYADQVANPATFQNGPSSASKPGEHGEWGDQTGGSGAGFADGSGGRPQDDLMNDVHGLLPFGVLKDINALAGPTSPTDPTNPDGGIDAGTQPGGGGKGCLSGTWTTPACGPSSAQLQRLTFDNDTMGKYANPDCATPVICSDLMFPFGYTVVGSSVTLHYSDPPQPTCKGIDNPPKLGKPANDTFTFTCEGGSLVTTTTSTGAKTTYTR